MGVFKNTVSNKIFDPKRDEIIRGWRKLHAEELHDLYSSPNIIGLEDNIKMDHEEKGWEIMVKMDQIYLPQGWGTW
jgi:hypothetical protein